MAMQLYVIILCTCYISRLQALPIRANKSWPYYWWPHAQELMAKSKSGDACDNTEPLGDRDGYKEFCLCKLVQGLKPAAGMQALFDIPTPGFVVSAGPPPNPNDYYKDNANRDKKNWDYVVKNWKTYWKIPPFGSKSPNECDGTEINPLCVTAHYNKLNNELLERSDSFTRAQPAEGFYEGQGEISQIVGFKNGAATNTIISDLLVHYAQDSILLFTGILGADQKRNISLQFANEHFDDAGNMQLYFALGSLQQYASYESIPKSQKFAYTQVGNNFYAGVVAATPYVTCTAK